MGKTATLKMLLPLALLLLLLPLSAAKKNTRWNRETTVFLEKKATRTCRFEGRFET